MLPSLDCKMLGYPTPPRQKDQRLSQSQRCPLVPRAADLTETVPTVQVERLAAAADVRLRFSVAPPTLSAVPLRFVTTTDALQAVVRIRVVVRGKSVTTTDALQAVVRI